MQDEENNLVKLITLFFMLFLRLKNKIIMITNPLTSIKFKF